MTENTQEVPMKDYIGTKEISACPAGRLSSDKPNEPMEDGYTVVYPGGYKSWSPKFVFEQAYRDMSKGMTFGDAIHLLKQGRRVARKGWNGKGMWVVLMTGMSLPPFNTQGTEKKVNDRTAKWIGEDTPLETLPYIAMWTADKKWLPGWLASQTDMLAEDWVAIH